MELFVCRRWSSLPAYICIGKINSLKLFRCCLWCASWFCWSLREIARKTKDYKRTTDGHRIGKMVPVSALLELEITINEWRGNTDWGRYHSERDLVSEWFIGLVCFLCSDTSIAMMDCHSTHWMIDSLTWIFFLTKIDTTGSPAGSGS